MMFWETFWATMWGALGGAVVGALVAWLFSLDLRRREKEDRQQERAQDRLDRESEREQDRLERQEERDTERRDRVEAQERSERAESARRWLAIGSALSSVWAVADEQKSRLLSEATARISDAYVLSPVEERPIAELLKGFSPEHLLEPEVAGAISGLLNRYSRGDDDVETAIARLKELLDRKIQSPSGES